mmetsp:Transcript_9652/g.33279  ORF Transcript_9652/g.33279 Transcript_9652/m.33279 type:complete len:214 (-) Transcript_9652:675-1316(-)
MPEGSPSSSPSTSASAAAVFFAALTTRSKLMSAWALCPGPGPALAGLIGEPEAATASLESRAWESTKAPPPASLASPSLRSTSSSPLAAISSAAAPAYWGSPKDLLGLGSMTPATSPASTSISSSSPSTWPSPELSPQLSCSPSCEGSGPAEGSSSLTSTICSSPSPSASLATLVNPKEESFLIPPAALAFAGAPSCSPPRSSLRSLLFEPIT